MQYAIADKAETGQQSPRQRPDGDRRSDDGKPKDNVGIPWETWQRAKLLESSQMFNRFS